MTLLYHVFFIKTYARRHCFCGAGRTTLCALSFISLIHLLIHCLRARSGKEGADTVDLIGASIPSPLLLPLLAQATQHSTTCNMSFDGGVILQSASMNRYGLPPNTNKKFESQRMTQICLESSPFALHEEQVLCRLLPAQSVAA